MHFHVLSPPLEFPVDRNSVSFIPLKGIKVSVLSLPAPTSHPPAVPSRI